MLKEDGSLLKCYFLQNGADEMPLEGRFHIFYPNVVDFFRLSFQFIGTNRFIYQ